MGTMTRAQCGRWRVAQRAAPGRSNGYVLWEGPSQLNGKPVVLIATGFSRDSDNTKTGAVIQTWILRSDIPPIEAQSTGEDAAICGDCPLRHSTAKRTDPKAPAKPMCYVNVGRSPKGIWDAYKRGYYPHLDPTIAGQIAKTRGLPVRAGSYGDPAAVAPEVWNKIFAVQEERTGYTHQWRTHPELADKVMASVGSEAEREQAKELGFRTFRVMTPSEQKEPGEILCPASKEGGFKTTCTNCQLCSGATPGDKRKDIAIYDHGPTAPKGLKALPMAGQARCKRCGHETTHHGAARTTRIPAFLLTRRNRRARYAR